MTKPPSPQPTCETCAHWKPGRRKASSRSVDWTLSGYCRRECAPTSNTGRCAAHQPIERVRVEIERGAA